MARFAISQEGADAMRQVSQNIISSFDGIDQSTKNLKTQIMGYMDDLGVYGPDIWAMTMQIDNILEDKRDALFELAEKANHKSDEILELIGAAIYGGGGKRLASEAAKPKTLKRDLSEATSVGMRAIDAQMDLVRADCKDKGITDPDRIEEIVQQKREAAEIDFFNNLYGKVDERTLGAFNRLSSFFSKDTWETLDKEEREDALNTLAVDVGDAYRTDIKGVIFFDGPPQSRGYYNGNRYLYLNSDCLSISENRVDALDTIFHEGRHAFQHAAVNEPHKHGVTSEQARIWDDNFKHYLTSEKFGYDRYYNQPVEADAFSFAEYIIKSGGIE